MIFFFSDTRRCFRYLAFWGKQNHFVFIGDTRLQMIYEAFVSHLQSASVDVKTEQKLDEKSNLEFVDYKLKLRVEYIYADDVDKVVGEFSKWIDDVVPSAVVVSCTHNHFFNGNLTEEILQNYSKNLTRIVQPIEKLITKKSKILWKLQDPIDSTDVLISNNDWKNISNEDIDKYNHAAYEILKYTEVHVWSSSRLIASNLLDEMKSVYKLGPLALQHNIQILLNMYCNDYMNYDDGTCCSSAESYTILQVVTYAVLGVCSTLSFAIILRKWFQKLRGKVIYSQLNDTTLPGQTTVDYKVPIFAVSILTVIMIYFYLCDRTNFFMKENKYYSEFSFWIPVGYIFALGLFFTEDSKYSKVLHRDQTNELKGWMQLVILIYHMTGADRVLPIYMHIKVLISAYLFLSGYGHFTYLWQPGNGGIVRFFRVMFRINFMTIVLCLCMNRPYQFYYYVPLISFWFIMIYFLLSLPPRITALNSESYQNLYLVLKFIGILSVVTILYMSEVFFERIFVTRPFKALFVTTDDDIREWWYRWKLDRYTITFGMIFGAVFQILQKYNIIDDNIQGNLFSKRISLTVTLFAMTGIGFYTTFSFLCKNRNECEEIHSYIVFIPIISYIILRNISGILRTRYSAFFAWFGKISLELFICQYHIWLAADRHGVLVLIPGFPTLNVIITTFIFICASHEINRITLVLIPYAVPNDWKIVLRNFVIFLLILIPIGKYDGMI